MTATDTTDARKKIRWPRVHLIYFLLAAFDLVAVMGGLYLSYRLSSIFIHNVSTNEEWGDRFKSVWNLNQIAVAVKEPASDVFDSRDADGELKELRAELGRFYVALAGVRSEIMANVPQSMAARPLGAFRNVNSAMADVAIEAQAVIAAFRSGDVYRATLAMSRMEGRDAVLQGRLNEASDMMLNIQKMYAAQNYAQVQNLKRYEYFIGAGIILMVCFVAFYGHWIGRLMRRKYIELAASNDQLSEAQAESMAFATQLQAVNDDVTKLNVDLADNLKRLKEAQDEIVRKGRLAQLGQLTATVAHELRNPLGAVRTSAFLIERKLKDKNLGIESQLLRITNGIVRCDAIITQLLDFARSNALQCDTLDFDDWLAKLVEEEAQKLPAAVAVECDLGLGGFKVPFDPPRMSRVLINLISNASEAMVGKGDDPAKFTCASPRIVIATRQTARGIEVTVADCGPGMTPEVVSRVLEPLFTTKNFGTGLGLPAVEKILQQHGGGLEIASEPGGGAQFTAWIPIVQPERRAA